MHWMLHCDFARSCWLSTGLALRTGDISGTPRDFMLWMAKHTDSQQWTHFANCVWALWRCRNDNFYNGTKISKQTFDAYLNLISSESLVASSVRRGGVRGEAGNQPVQAQPALIGSRSCHVDGSWKEGWLGGVGFAFSRNGALQAYRSARRLVCCALQAEAYALLEALTYAVSKGWQECTFYTDCQVIQRACSSLEPPVDLDWRVYKKGHEIWRILKLHEGYHCLHIDRSQNDLADRLAKLGRIKGWDQTGFTYPMFPMISESMSIEEVD